MVVENAISDNIYKHRAVVISPDTMSFTDILFMFFWSIWRPLALFFLCLSFFSFFLGGETSHSGWHTCHQGRNAYGNNVHPFPAQSHHPWLWEDITLVFPLFWLWPRHTPWCKWWLLKLKSRLEKNNTYNFLFLSTFKLIMSWKCWAKHIKVPHTALSQHWVLCSQWTTLWRPKAL